MKAVDRYGSVFELGEMVKMKDYPILYKSMIGEELIIEDIKEVDHSESGFNILARHKQSGNLFKRWLDTNWFTKI